MTEHTAERPCEACHGTRGHWHPFPLPTAQWVWCRYCQGTGLTPPALVAQLERIRLAEAQDKERYAMPHPPPP